MLKHTHTHTHTQTNIHTKKNNNNKKRQHQSPFPRNKHPYNTSDRGPNGNSQGIEAVNCCCKDLHTRGCRDSRSTSFLCKYNLTKSYLASVSLLKHFSISCKNFFSSLHYAQIVSFRYAFNIYQQMAYIQVSRCSCIADVHF